MVKKIFLILLIQTCCLIVVGKSTYIAKYRSYIHIVNGTDTVSVDNNLPELEMTENGGLFSIRIEHEEVTQEKVKAIKRAKSRAGWMAFSAVMSGVSTAFSNNSLQYYIRSTKDTIRPIEDKKLEEYIDNIYRNKQSGFNEKELKEGTDISSMYKNIKRTIVSQDEQIMKIILPDIQ